MGNTTDETVHWKLKHEKHDILNSSLTDSDSTCSANDNGLMSRGFLDEKPHTVVTECKELKRLLKGFLSCHAHLQAGQLSRPSSRCMLSVGTWLLDKEAMQ